jgi:type II restriction/modification system DNA methylase subunit YeeA
MTPEFFIKKWQKSELKERSASQSHFNDLCSLLGEDNPTDADQAGDWFCFEKGAKKTGGGDGWADVWKRGHFGWEYKGPGKDLNKAYQQLQRYAVALENPPLLVVSDCRDIIIHTNFTNAVYETHTILLEEIGEPENLQKLKWLFTDPERLRPGQTRDAVTEKVAKAFASIAQRLRDDGHDPHKVAHFVNRLLFCMFAEDIELLPDKLFTRMLEACERTPERFAPMAKGLFAAMRSGGFFGADEIAWFNGGLFDDDEALPLDSEGVKQTLIAARMDWSSIEPSIFGTMFERGLDPAKRSQLGAHYTDAEKIMLIIEPVILRPLRQEWNAAKAGIEQGLEKAAKAKSKSARTKAYKEPQRLFNKFLDRLRGVQVLDPACGSGNFLYLALMNLKDLEHRVLLEAETMGLGMQMPELGPEVVKGIEINPYASELARVTVWIGQIQWMISHGFSANRRPILQSLGNIENRDALINEDATEAEWPEAEFIVGNPPFIGAKKHLSELGDEYMSVIRKVYANRVPGSADLVTYWFKKSSEYIVKGKVRRAGLVATNSIRDGGSRKVLESILELMPIFVAWGDEAWVVDGASVRVSLIGFGYGDDSPVLDGQSVKQIHANLTGDTFNASQVKNNQANLSLAFRGDEKHGDFDLPGIKAREWLLLPSNPNRCTNSDVLRPWSNGFDIVRRPQDKWVIDFGVSMSEEDASLYEVPFEHVATHLRPARQNNKMKSRRVNWWRHGMLAAAMRKSLEGLTRYIITPVTSKYRLFDWRPTAVLPDGTTVAIACEDDATFGILHSRFHEVWALRMGTSLEDRPRYTPSTTFETFPFPEGLTPNTEATDYSDGSRAIRIAEAAKRLDELRKNWLNPEEWVDRVPEVVAGYPDRIIAKAGHEGDLKKRTLTNLYNARPAWLDHIHKELDAAVAAAYGWDDYTPDMPDEEILARLFKLNQERANGH